MHTALTLAAAVAATAVLVAPAGSASADSPQNTINYWQQQGYTVNIDRVGSGPMDSCVVTSVRNPNTITRFVRENTRGPGPSYLVPVIVSRTVQISLYCAG